MELTIEQALQEGIAAHKEGKLQDAERFYLSILQSQPTHADANHNLGVLAVSANKADVALPLFKTALETNPKVEQFWLSYIDALIKEKQFESAKKVLEHAQKQSVDKEKLNNLEAQLFSKNLNINTTTASPPQEVLDSLLGHYQNGRLNDAEKLAVSITNEFPKHQFGWKVLGAVLGATGRSPEAVNAHETAVILSPQDADSHYNLAITLQELRRLGEAEVSYRQAIVLKPDYADAHYNLGITLQELGRLNEAEASYRQAIVLKPDYADVHYNLGNTLQELGKLSEAEASYRQAIKLKPDYTEAHYNLSFTLLNSGELKEGLEKYEWRWKVARNFSENRYFRQPLWDGQKNLQGKRILLWSEQGIGDTINWASCLPLVASLAEHTILECQEKIVSLLARSFPNIEIKPEERSMDSKRDDFDFHLPMGSLYRHFIPHIGENSNIDSYLVPDPVRVRFWRARLGSLGKGPYIGIAWKSSKVSPLRLKHYPPISEWSSVLTVPDVTFINLQYSGFANDLTNVKNDIGVTVHNFDDLDQSNDVDDVVALCAALDMVVSTKVTPLIFSSGVRTPTKVANWRQSIWNSILFNPVCSSVEMFNRDTGEPWDKVFESIAVEILKLKTETVPNS